MKACGTKPFWSSDTNCTTALFIRCVGVRDGVGIGLSLLARAEVDELALDAVGEHARQERVRLLVHVGLGVHLGALGDLELGHLEGLRHLHLELVAVELGHVEVEGDCWSLCCEQGEDKMGSVDDIWKAQRMS